MYWGDNEEYGYWSWGGKGQETSLIIGSVKTCVHDGTFWKSSLVSCPECFYYVGLVMRGKFV